MEYIFVKMIAHILFIKNVELHVSYSVNYAIKQNNEIICQHTHVVSRHHLWFCSYKKLITYSVIMSTIVHNN